MTDPGEAAEFVERTGVDALAVAVGNVHGLTTTPVSLDLDRLAAIKAAVPVPLVLHGASGLPDQQLAEAIRCGVAKININTELRQGLPRRAVSPTDRAVHPRQRRFVVRRPRGGDHRRHPLHPRLVRNQLGNPQRTGPRP